MGTGVGGDGCEGSDGGVLFTCQSSESSSAKKLSDINKKELKLKESAKLGKRVFAYSYLFVSGDDNNTLNEEEHMWYG
jgi:hypothetical protein